ncbi:MAG: magnesium/cobalt transporter CorA [Nitrosospira sp.]|nr:magnesium/cobalt transporter CorA [Nitrosospira sp.]
MASHFKKRSTKAGLPPGTLVHIGKKKSVTPNIILLDYDESNVHESSVTAADLADKIKLARDTKWINVRGLGDAVVMKQIGACFDLHPLVLEDILNTEQRSKLEDYGDYLYVVLKTFGYESKGAEERINSDQISLVLGKNFVLSFLETDGVQFESVRERLHSGKGQIRKSGADFLMYSLIDAIVDSYFVILERLDEKTEVLETELIARPQPGTLHSIYRLKREGVFLRKSLWPLREVISALQREDSPLFTRNTLLYLRDVYDHIIHIIESVESLRDQTAGMLDIYMSSVSYRISAVMKVLTVITTIFMPLSLIAGIYGMNFDHLPGLEWRWGFFVVLGTMAAISVGMLILFHWKKWL